MRKKNRRVFIYISGAIIFSIIVGKSLISDQMLDNLAASIMYPILLAQNKIVQPIKVYFEKKHIAQELHVLLKQLQAERDNLAADNIQLQSLISFMDQTQEHVQFKKQYDLHDAHLAQVLVKHFSDQSHFFLIDKGSNSGIEPDMVAIYKNCLLGKVVEVYPHYSKVLLLTDRQCKVAAYCTHTKASGIHTGCNHEKMSGLQYVTHLAEVDPGDLVLSSGDGLIFPKGFAIGRIKACKPEGLFYDVSIEMMLDFRKIDYCFIIQKGYKQTSIVHKIEASEQLQTGSNNAFSDTQFQTCGIVAPKQLKAEQFTMMQVEKTEPAAT